MVHLITADEQAQHCPDCGTRARRFKGRRVTRPRDLPVGGRRPRLVWTRYRWRCDEPACRRRSFTESVPAVPPRKRLTSRLRATAGPAVADGDRGPGGPRPLFGGGGQRVRGEGVEIGGPHPRGTPGRTVVSFSATTLYPLRSGLHAIRGNLRCATSRPADSASTSLTHRPP
ncbi:transposase family protein [Micromonospora sp. NPDC023814]|uniref:transposase family protein n=1 Tax=Micromonospora sp. NPDC023814 TaxID=3154596 RepID=UPI0033ED9DC3